MDPNSFYYDDGSDNGNGGGVFSQVLQAATQLGTTAILASGSPNNTNLPYPGPAGSYNAGGTYGYAAPRSGGMSFLTILILVVVGFFAFTRLGK